MTYTAPTALTGSVPNPVNAPLTGSLSWAPSTTLNPPVLLLHFDGNFSDSSGNNWPVDANSTYASLTAPGYFGSGALQVSTLSSFESYCVEVPYTGGSALDIFTQPSWTIEGWILANAYNSSVPSGNQQFFISYGDSGSTAPAQYVNIQFTINSDGTAALNVYNAGNGGLGAFSAVSGIGGTVTYTAGVWYHVALVNNAGITTIYFDGEAVGSTNQWTPSTYRGYFSPANVCIGSLSGAGSLAGGEIDEVRISAVAQYTANFTPPTAPFAGGGGNPPGYDLYRNGVSVDTFIGGTACTDIVPALGIYEYQVAAWDGTEDASALSTPFYLTYSPGIGGVPTFLNDELICGAVFGGVLNLVEFVYMPDRAPFLEGATNLILNRYKQEPGDSRQRGVDYTFFLVPGELLQTVTVSDVFVQGVSQEDTDPLVTPLEITDLIIDPLGMKFAYTVSGGQDGTEYSIQFTTTTQLQTSNVTEIFSINILIEDSFP